MFSIRANTDNQTRLEPVRLPERSQMELTLEAAAESSLPAQVPPPSPAAAPDPAATPEPGTDIDGWIEEFGLSAHQRETVCEYVQIQGPDYVHEKAEIIRGSPRDNAARAFLAALKQDWKAPRAVRPKRAPAPKPPTSGSEPAGWREFLRRKYPEAKLPETYVKLLELYPSLGKEVRLGLAKSS